jgi:hypothetical protein
VCDRWHKVERPEGRADWTCLRSRREKRVYDSEMVTRSARVAVGALTRTRETTEMIEKRSRQKTIKTTRRVKNSCGRHTANDTHTIIS